MHSNTGEAANLRDAGVSQTEATSALRAVREIVTCLLVHKDASTARALVAEYLEEHDDHLVAAAAAFTAFHCTDPDAPAELADDRFVYLVHKVVDLIELHAESVGEDLPAMLIAWTDKEPYLALELPGAEWRALMAAHACMISHAYGRQGRSSWGLQQGFDTPEKWLVAHQLANLLGPVACSVEGTHREQVVNLLLSSIEHILRRQAKGVGSSLEALIADYFSGLASQEVEAGL